MVEPHVSATPETNHAGVGREFPLGGSHGGAELKGSEAEGEAGSKAGSCGGNSGGVNDKTVGMNRLGDRMMAKNNEITFFKSILSCTSQEFQSTFIN